MSHPRDPAGDPASPPIPPGRTVAHFHALMESSPTAVVVLRPDGAVADCNRRAAALFGLPAERLVASPFPDGFFPADEAAAVRSDISAILSGAVHRRRREVRAATRGPAARLSADLFGVHDEGGTTLFVVIAFEEVGERRRLDMQALTQRKLESVGRLAAGIAHEINSPVQFIGDNLAFVERSVEVLQALRARYRSLIAEVPGRGAELIARADAAEARADLEFIVDELPRALEQARYGVDKIGQIVRGMKALAPKEGAERASLDLNDALRDVVAVAHNELKYVADVCFDLEPIPRVLCNADDLHQVLLQVLVRAGQAVEHAVGESGARGRIDVATRAGSDHVSIVITDTGTAFATGEEEEEIFEPFFSPFESGAGAVNGLALARAVIVDQHGGSFDVKRRDPAGTTFAIRLPTRSPEVTPPRPP